MPLTMPEPQMPWGATAVPEPGAMVETEGRCLASIAMRSMAPGMAWAGTKLPGATKSKYSTSEKPTSYQDITGYNNFYEFGTDKSDPARAAGSRIVPRSLE